MSATEPVTWKRRVGLVVAFVAVFLVVGQLLSLLVQSGALWRLVASSLVEHEEHLAQHALFSVPDRQRVDVLLIGDALFLDKMTALLPSPAATLEVRLPVVNLRDYAEVLRRVPADRTSAVVLQNSPVLWSNYATVARGQDFRLWDAVADGELSLLPIEDARLVFRTIESWARGPAGDQHRDWYRLTNLDQLAFDPNPPDASALDAALASSPATHVVWVEDLEGFDAASNSTLIEQFRASNRQGGPGADRGEFVPFDDPSLRERLGELVRADG